MSGIFSRDARSQVYSILRSIMQRTDGTASINDCILECDKHGVEVDRSQIASARNQYKRMKAAAMAAGEKLPAIPTPVIPEQIEEPEEQILESIESMSDYSEIEEAEEKACRDHANVPAVNPHYVFSAEQLAFLEAIEKLSLEDFKKGLPSSRNQLVGAAGCGKTTLAIQFAAKYKRPCFIIDCQTLREALSLFGNKTVTKDGIKWVFSKFVEAVRTPRAVIVMDEVNRVAPMSMNTSLPLLDDRRSLWFDEAGEEIKVANGVNFFSTQNLGAEFTGTESLDSALDDRFEYVIPVDYISPDDEAKLLVNTVGIPSKVANDLAMVAKVVRDKYKSGTVYTKTISTRILCKAAKLYKIGGDLMLKNSLIYRFPCDGTTDSERNTLTMLLRGKGFKV